MKGRCDWDVVRRGATAEERRIIDFYDSMVRHNTDGSLQQKTLPLLNRVVHEIDSCYEYRQNAQFYLDVFTIVRGQCADADGTMDHLIRKLKALTTVAAEETTLR